MDRREANLKRDRRLRRRLLSTLSSARAYGPTGAIGGRTLCDTVDSVMPRDQRLEDDEHAIGLLRDLELKGFAEATDTRKRRSQAFSLDVMEYRITAAGQSLLDETRAADPDVDDERNLEE